MAFFYLFIDVKLIPLLFKLKNETETGLTKFLVVAFPTHQM